MAKGMPSLRESALQRRKSLGKLRFLRFLALHGGNHPFEVGHCFSGVNDVHGLILSDKHPGPRQRKAAFPSIRLHEQRVVQIVDRGRVAIAAPAMYMRKVR